MLHKNIRFRFRLRITQDSPVGVLEQTYNIGTIKIKIQPLAFG